jgi:hypothetical protein
MRAAGTSSTSIVFSPEYLARLKEFIAAAGQRGIIVELTLFCSTYNDSQWAVHPCNSTNNIQAFPVPDWKQLHTVAVHPAFLERQTRLVQWLVRELSGFDNLFFEIQNEPWSDSHTMGDFINPYMVEPRKFPNAVQITSAASVAWQRRIARVIVDTERDLPLRHLIAQNIANFRLPVNDEDLVPEASILDFHYAYPEVVDWNRGLRRVIGYDETGFAGKDDATYRRQAWDFVLNSLDYSFTLGREDGTDIDNPAPGGGSPTLRRQLKVLSDFIHRFELATLEPGPLLVARAPGVVPRVLSSRDGKAHALYLQGRSPTTIELHLANGRWTAEWSSVETGAVLRRETVKAARPVTAVRSPDFTDAIALRLCMINGVPLPAQDASSVTSPPNTPSNADPPNRMITLRTILTALLLASAMTLSAQDDKARVFVLTDISNEPDDEESMCVSWSMPTNTTWKDWWRPPPPGSEAGPAKTSSAGSSTLTDRSTPTCPSTRPAFPPRSNCSPSGLPTRPTTGWPRSAKASPPPARATCSSPRTNRTTARFG